MNMARKKFFSQYNQNLKNDKRKIDFESPYFGMNKYRYPGSEDYLKVYSLKLIYN